MNKLNPAAQMAKYGKNNLKKPDIDTDTVS